MACAAMQGCSMEQPFAGGEGTLSMKVQVNSDVTRALVDDSDLADRCVVYISSAKGLVRKYQGVSQVPQSLPLTQGSYVAEAWTGDSVSASFDKRFFRGYEPFVINDGQVSSVTLTCKIANVVVSVDHNSFDASLMRDFNINVASSRGELDFTPENYTDAKGYFMMPFTDGVRESKLTVTVTGTNIEGKAFTKTHVIENARPTHEYIVNLDFDPSQSDTDGGKYLTIAIDETELEVKDTVPIFAAPLIEGVGFDIDKQVRGEAGQFADELRVNIVAFNEIQEFTIECEDTDNLHLPAQKVDVKTASNEVIAQLHAAGIDWDKNITDVEGYDGNRRQQSYLIFTRDYLNSLPERPTEYRIGLTCLDGNGRTREKTLRIAVGEEAVIEDDPLVLDDAVNPIDLMAIGARKATLTATLADETAENAAIRYREAGTDAWTVIPVQPTRAGRKVSVSLTDLKPGTRYEYQAVADGFTSDSKYFTTEEVFVIPNASLEEWSNYSSNSKVLLPGAGGERTFWDTGNHGSATMSVTLTKGSTDMFHSGTQSARLRSQFVALGVIGKFAAGNLFTGEYYKTNGTNGELYFGREYNGSHPSALKVFVNYRPAAADKNGSKNGYLKQGDLDKGQIYVALTTKKIHIDTRYPDTMLWNTDAPEVLAYGEKIFSENYGPDGQLQELTIPISYRSSAKTNTPVYLVIVCTASYYGDYFDGGEGSTMYVDDFELLYE